MIAEVGERSPHARAAFGSFGPDDDYLAFLDCAVEDRLEAFSSDSKTRALPVKRKLPCH